MNTTNRGKARFGRSFTTVNHILTLWALVEEGIEPMKRCDFDSCTNFLHTFTTMPWLKLVQWLQSTRNSYSTKIQSMNMRERFYLFSPQNVFRPCVFFNYSFFSFFSKLHLLLKSHPSKDFTAVLFNWTLQNALCDPLFQMTLKQF